MMRDSEDSQRQSQSQDSGAQRERQQGQQPGRDEEE